MIDTKTLLLLLLLFIIIFMNNIGGAHGVGEEADHQNDLLFGEMWRKALALNSQHNLAQLNSDQKREEKPKEVKVEGQNEEDDQTMGEKENKIMGKIKMEPIFDQTEGTDSDQKNAKKIKKEPKIEENTFKQLREKWHTKNGQNATPSDQNKSDRSADQNNKIKSKKRKLAIVNEFERMRKEYKGRNKGQHATKIAREIAKELGEPLKDIFKWRNEIRSKESHNYETKLKIIKEFDKMRKEYKLKNDYKNEKRHKIESEIAKELGTYRNKIYEWKKEICKKKKQEAVERRIEIIKKFEKIKRECKLKNNFKKEDRYEIESEISKALGTCRAQIYKWKDELYKENRKKQIENVVKRWCIKKFDKMRREYKLKNDYKREDRNKIESEIAMKFGTYRDKIYEWKKEMCEKKEQKGKERKRAIIGHFDRLKDEFSNKFNMKMSREIEGKIARKFGVCLRTIFNWRSVVDKSRHGKIPTR